jgi:hypothetical protein
MSLLSRIYPLSQEERTNVKNFSYKSCVASWSYECIWSPIA